MKIQSAALPVAMAAFALVPGACSTTSGAPSSAAGSSNSAGAFGSGGSSGSGVPVGAGGMARMDGAGGACTSVTACGGSVVGTWSVASSCLRVSGNLDLKLVGAGCTSAPVTGSLSVTGTWTANADGTYADHTTTTGEERFTLAPECLVISSTQTDCNGAGSIIASLGYSAVNCTAVAAGGCDCTASIKQSGGPGLLSVYAAASGNYKAAGNTLELDEELPYSYCVSGDSMSWTPQSASPATTGTLTFQKSGTSGSGGSGGTTGAAGSSSASGGSASGGTGGIVATGGSNAMGGAGGGTGTGMGPCDIYKSGGTPCAAAHSTVRALFGAYSGKLYQVRNAGGTTKDISAVIAGGVADAAAQDTFCSGTTCVITVVYDQTGKGNDLWYQGAGAPADVAGADVPASATGESVKMGGNKVYSLYIKPKNSYWVNGSTKGMPTGSAPEGMYMVTSGTHYNSGCCFDYGNSETTRKYAGPGTMDALNFSNTTSWGTGAGTGPWVMADLEAGLFAGPSGKGIASNPTQTAPFITAVLKNNGTTEYSLKGGDATTGSLSTYYKGALPSGWSPMKKQGAIVLGSGGDCCIDNTNQSQGTFYEGCIVSGYPSDSTESAVQANIVAAKYSK